MRVNYFEYFATILQQLVGKITIKFVFFRFHSGGFPQEIKINLVGTGGFEPPTPRTPSVCATRLRHVPTE